MLKTRVSVADQDLKRLCYSDAKCTTRPGRIGLQSTPVVRLIVGYTKNENILSPTTLQNCLGPQSFFQPGKKFGK